MTQQQRPPGGGKTNLMVACEQGRTLEVKIILQKKPQAASIRDRTNKTALHYCAESGSLPCAQLVLASDPGLLDSPDSEGHTSLHIAVISGNKGMARFLLKHGADPDKVDRERHSSVHWAAVCGDTESLDLLLSHGANPSTPDILGAYPVHYAAQMCVPNALNGKAPQEGLDVLRKLLEGGASTQCRDRDGREPLMWAASAAYGRYECAEVFIHHKNNFAKLSNILPNVQRLAGFFSKNHANRRLLVAYKQSIFANEGRRPSLCSWNCTSFTLSQTQRMIAAQKRAKMTQHAFADPSKPTTNEVGGTYFMMRADHRTFSQYEKTLDECQT